MKPLMSFSSLILFLLAAVSAAADDLDARFRLSLDRVLKGGPPEFTTDFVLADAVPRHVRRFTEFSGDVSGRYLDALARAEALTGGKIQAMDAVLDGLAAAQKPEGFFGDAFPDGEIKPMPHMALLWGNGRMLVGLMEVHARRGDARALAMARKLGDFLVAIGPRLNNDAVQKAFTGDQHAVGYICWTHAIEGLVALHAATKDARYLDLASGMASRVSMHEGQHSHGFLSSLRGMVMLSAATGDKQWIENAARLWQQVIETGNLLPHGCIPEAFKPMILRDEGCSEADWVRLSLDLWRATREPKYLEAAEHALFNEFALNQFSTGDFGHRTISGTGVGGAILRAPKGGGTNAAFSAVGILYGQARAWWCCTFHGLRTFPEAVDAAFHAGADGALCYDLPVSGAGSAGGLSAKAVSTLQQDATARLEITAAGGGEAALAMRCPSWAGAPVVSVNGKTVAAAPAGGRATVRRAWAKGDRVEIRYPLKTAVVKSPAHPGQFALQHGPWMLGVEPAGSACFFDEPMSRNVVQVPGGLERPALSHAPAGAAPLHPFAVPAARFELPFLPGGYAVQPQKALLRPLAEQTGLRDENEWVFWFKAAGK